VLPELYSDQVEIKDVVEEMATNKIDIAQDMKTRGTHARWSVRRLRDREAGISHDIGGILGRLVGKSQ
jgi:hypothetical protein